MSSSWFWAWKKEALSAFSFLQQSATSRVYSAAFLYPWITAKSSPISLASGECSESTWKGPTKHLYDDRCSPPWNHTTVDQVRALVGLHWAVSPIFFIKMGDK